MVLSILLRFPWFRFSQIWSLALGKWEGGLDWGAHLAKQNDLVKAVKRSHSTFQSKRWKRILFKIIFSCPDLLHLSGEPTWKRFSVKILFWQKWYLESFSVLNILSPWAGLQKWTSILKSFEILCEGRFYILNFLSKQD